MRAHVDAPRDHRQPEQHQQQPRKHTGVKHHHRRRRRHSISVADHRTAAASDLTPTPPANSTVAPMPRRLTASQRRLSLSSMSFAPTSSSVAALASATHTSPSKLLLQRSAEPAVDSATRSLPRRSDAPNNRRRDTAPLTSPVRVLEKQPERERRNVARRSSSAPPRAELPILRAQYVARGVRVLIGTRWKLRKFEPKTVVLRTNGSSSRDATAPALPVLVICPATAAAAADNGAQQFALPLDLKCGHSGPNELKLKSDSFRMKIRFATAADAGIWLKVLRATLAHARWVRDVEETAFLSRDAASSVRLARHALSQQEFVIKVLPGVRVDDMANAELLVLKKLFASAALPYIREYRVVETPSDTRIVMPKFPGRNLLQFLQQQQPTPRQKLSEADARAVTRGLCAALLALHEVGIVHCDVKLENILLADVSDVRVIDFGGAFDITAVADSDAAKTHSRRARAAVPHRMIGTPGYIAPERILFVDEPPTPAADVFSAGIVLFQLLTGRQPFVRPSRSHRRALSMQDTTALHWPAAEKILSQHGVSAAAAALVERMVDPDPQARISLEQVARDPWLR